MDHGEGDDPTTEWTVASEIRLNRSMTRHWWPCSYYFASSCWIQRRKKRRNMQLKVSYPEPSQTASSSLAPYSDGPLFSYLCPCLFPCCWRLRQEHPVRSSLPVPRTSRPLPYQTRGHRKNQETREEEHVCLEQSLLALQT